MCNGAVKQVSAGVATCNIKGRDSFGNVETGLEMLFTWPKPVSDWLTQRRVARPIETTVQCLLKLVSHHRCTQVSAKGFNM